MVKILPAYFLTWLRQAIDHDFSLFKLNITFSKTFSKKINKKAKTCNAVLYLFLRDIYIGFWRVLIIKREIYFGSSFSALIFAVRF